MKNDSYNNIIIIMSLVFMVCESIFIDANFHCIQSLLLLSYSSIHWKHCKYLPMYVISVISIYYSYYRYYCLLFIYENNVVFVSSIFVLICRCWRSREILIIIIINILNKYWIFYIIYINVHVFDVCINKEEKIFNITI